MLREVYNYQDHDVEFLQSYQTYFDVLSGVTLMVCVLTIVLDFYVILHRYNNVATFACCEGAAPSSLVSLNIISCSITLMSPHINLKLLFITLMLIGIWIWVYMYVDAFFFAYSMFYKVCEYAKKNSFNKKTCIALDEYGKTNYPFLYITIT